MKRAIGLVTGLALVIGLQASMAIAAPAAKTEVCHVTGASDITFGLNNPDRTWAWGIILKVPEKALAAHIAHGDSTDFRVEEGDQGWINLHWAAENRDDLKIHKQAECFFEVFPPEPEEEPYDEPEPEEEPVPEEEEY